MGRFVKGEMRYDNMDIEIRRLNFQRCWNFVSDKFDLDLKIYEDIFNLSRFEEGDFYALIPKLVSEDFLYDFKSGGLIFPYAKPIEVSVVQTINFSEENILSSIKKYLNNSPSNYVGLLDYSFSVDSDFIKNNVFHFYLLDGKIFYLLDNRTTENQVNKYYGYSKGQFFFVSTFQIPTGQALSLTERGEVENETRKLLLSEIDNLLFEVYDGDSFLIWSRRGKNVFFEILKHIIES